MRAIAIMALSAVAAAGGLVLLKRPGPPAPLPVPVTAVASVAPSQAPMPTVAAVPAALPEAAPPAPVVSSSPVQTVTQVPPAAKPSAPAKAKPPIQDPMARTALSFVGMDPEAEQYWLGAINDPTLSAHERQDLIEDLNEDGLSDPHHPTVDDLPLIVNRLLMIQDLAPYAMDEVNADAFEEAHKDLLNMYARLTQ